MTKKLSILALLLCTAAAATADVRPVIMDKPLALRPDPQSNLTGQTGLPDVLDYWSNIRVNSDNSGQVQNEEQIVCNPTNPNNVVAIWRDFRLGYRRVGIGYSMDGGSTWHDELMVEPTYAWQSDPGLTYHTSGAIYAVVLSMPPTGVNGLFVSRSLNGGVNWGPFYPAVNGFAGAFEDKELIACDRSGSPFDGNLYIAWARFTNNQTISRIYSVRSTNGGVSWGSAVPVSDGTSVQWPVPAVGPGGIVYVAWVRYSPAGIRIDRSFNGGVTWGTDITVQPTGFASANINPLLLIFAYPAMDVDITGGPNQGKVYIAYTDDPNGDTDIFFTASADSGSHWSNPIRLNDDPIGNGADQFHPWLVCDENGALHLIFYDRRLNVPQNLLMDVYYTHSENGGLTWAPNQRITDVSSNPGLDSLDSGLIGEYNGLDVRNSVVHPIWTDTRFLNQDAFTAVWSDSVNVNITLTPVSPPIVIPAIGGSFNFNATLTNAVTSPQTFGVWIMVRLPNQTWFGPVLGPLNLTLPGGGSLTRVRTQTVPASAPAGAYWYEGRVGVYPSTAWDSSGFAFTKLGSGMRSEGLLAEDLGVDDWSNTGEEFGESEKPHITHHSSLITSIRPNPFNPTTAISFQLSADSHVKLQVFDISGRLVATLVNGWREAGVHEVTFDGSGLPSGIYIYRITAGSWSLSEKMILLK